MIVDSVISMVTSTAAQMQSSFVIFPLVVADVSKSDAKVAAPRAKVQPTGEKFVNIAIIAPNAPPTAPDNPARRQSFNEPPVEAAAIAFDTPEMPAAIAVRARPVANETSVPVWSTVMIGLFLQ